eukprot:2936447-Alexandrium_andersonii.AAC.1
MERAIALAGKPRVALEGLLPSSLRRPSNRPKPSHRWARQPRTGVLSWVVPPVPLRYTCPPA